MEDTDILVNTAKLVLDEDGAEQSLLDAVQGTARPEAGVAMFVMMMIQSISDMLAQAGIEVAADTWVAQGGVLDQIMPDIEEILMDGGVEVGPDFGEAVASAVLERAKGAAEAEGMVEQAPAEQAPPAPSGGLLDTMGGMQ